ncbi:MAG TPA: hypothetical protein VHE34_08845 [Puia sp.]|uniref:hypothetical protein n=1 Tax=Puia sp. TaxID=2045100 RepID=UPI002CE36037|nr:hypothetical protein [Puia sp.]HVU95318.1 hypothetical protein [Puia sp.]
MTRKLHLAVLAVFCLYVSCKKSSNSNSSANPNRIKSYVEAVHGTPFDQTDTFSLGYDADGRLTTMTSRTLKMTYAYNGTASFTLDLYENGQFSIHELAFIKGGTVVDSTWQYNNSHDTTTEKYIFNGNVLISKITYDYSGGLPFVFRRNDYTYDNNGNLVKDVEGDGSGGINSITTYTYTNKTFQLATTPIYWPAQAKYLPATMTVKDGSGNPTATVTYAYVFDNAGRVTQETDAVDNGSSVVKSYIYY